MSHGGFLPSSRYEWILSPNHPWAVTPGQQTSTAGSAILNGALNKAPFPPLEPVTSQTALKKRTSEWPFLPL